MLVSKMKFSSLCVSKALFCTPHRTAKRLFTTPHHEHSHDLVRIIDDVDADNNFTGVKIVKFNRPDKVRNSIPSFQMMITVFVIGDQFQTSKLRNKVSSIE